MEVFTTQANVKVKLKREEMVNVLEAIEQSESNLIVIMITSDRG